MRRTLDAALTVALLALPCAARANGDAVAPGPPTVFERFVLSACSPCIRESYPVATLTIAPLTAAWLPRAAAAAATRPAEVAIDVVRARQPGRPGWTSLALRVTLSVMPSPGAEAYRVGVGLLDGTDVGALARAVAEMTAMATAPQSAGVESVDVDYHGGSLRIGVLRTHGEAIGYVQAGDLATLMQRAIWDVPTTLYLPLADVAALATALGQAVTTVEKVRAN